MAGLLVGLGYDCCLNHHASTAGLDVFALVIHRYWPHFSVAISLRCLNYVILLIGAWQFGWQSFLAGWLFILIYTQVMVGLTKRRLTRKSHLKGNTND